MKVFLIAGEASGDRLGADLMTSLKTLVPEVEFSGVGGDAMIARGLDSLFDMQELSVMGIVEVLPKYRHLKRRITETAEAVLENQPDVLVTIDSPDFCFRVAKRVKAASDIRVVHYVAPSVWAWRPGRAEKIAAYVDQVLALLPFEPPYMERAGIRCDFVGHPVAREPAPSDSDIKRFRKRLAWDEPAVLLLPGSRRAEIDRLLPIFCEVAEILQSNIPDIRLSVFAAPMQRDRIAGIVAKFAADFVVIDANDLPDLSAEDAKRAVFASADVALAASGTVALELAAVTTPTVVAYDMNWLSWQIMSRMALIDTVTISNLVTGEKVIPEYLGPDCKAIPIAEDVLALLEDETRRAAQKAHMIEALARMGRGGDSPSLLAARAVLEGLRRSG